MFKVGDKVVCVETSPSATTIKGYIYTIIGFRHDEPAFFFKEVPNHKPGIYYGHRINRFRKLDESFAEEVLENIMEQIEQEELVYV